MYLLQVEKLIYNVFEFGCTIYLSTHLNVRETEMDCFVLSLLNVFIIKTLHAASKTFMSIPPISALLQKIGISMYKSLIKGINSKGGNSLAKPQGIVMHIKYLIGIMCSEPHSDQFKTVGEV